MKHATDGFMLRHNIRRRGGYITLEAALVLPLFIIAVLAIGYYIKVFGVMENVSYSMMDETARIASKAYITESVPLFESKLKKRITEDVPEAEDVDISAFRYLYTDGDKNDLIYVRTGFEMDSELPLGFGHTYKSDVSVKCRGFTGTENKGTPMSFDEMEEEGTWESVWIFPDRGEKYHSSTCSYVKANVSEMVLTGEIKDKYVPCSQCDAEKAKTGEFVYCFRESGTAYHRENCRHVTRYTIEINKEDAVDKGYSPCSKCGGG